MRYRLLAIAKLASGAGRQARRIAALVRNKANRERPGFTGGRLTDLIGDLFRLPKQPSSLTE